MSTNSEEGNAVMCCVSCGTAEGGEVKLKSCAACRSVRYCGAKCQKNHRPHHKRACKERAAELRDEILFKQPESNHLGDCPICFLPMPIDPKKYSKMSCCSKIICEGCIHASDKGMMKGVLERKCAFCRKELPMTEKECSVNLMKRAEKSSDPFALYQIGAQLRNKGDFEKAREILLKATELGQIDAHNLMADMYMGGSIEMEGKKFLYHLEEAAIGGHPDARYNLGVYEVKKRGDFKRGVKHFIIAANQGCASTLQELQKLYRTTREAFVKKEDLNAALRGYQAVVDATKSRQREEADVFRNRWGY